MTLKVVKELTPETVEHGKWYIIVTEDGKQGYCKADVQEEWTEVHPRMVYFTPDDADLTLKPGARIVKILDAGANK